MNSLSISKSHEPQTFAAAVAQYFEARPYLWINGLELARVGGAYAWRSRVADARRQFGMRIDNRQRRGRRADGASFVVSEYRYSPASTDGRATACASSRPSPTEPRRGPQADQARGLDACHTEVTTE